MLTEEAVVDRIEISEDGTIGVRHATFVLRDGVRLAPAFHRIAYEPGADLGDEDARVKAIAGIIWTDDVKAASVARREAAHALLTGGQVQP
jgi:hypothetical protein